MTISLEDFSKCCRCCLVVVDALHLIPLFGACLDNMLMKVMNLQISRNDGYPQQICSRCVLKLSSAHTFHLTVMNSQRTLEDILKAAECNEESYGDTDDCDKNILNMKEKEINTLQIVPTVQHRISTQETPTKRIHNETRLLTSENRSNDANDDTIEFDSEESHHHQCLQCQHTTTNQEELKAHLKTHLVGDKDHNLSEVKDVYAHLCYYCGARFRVRTSLLKHLRRHRGPHHECRHCHRRFAEASTLTVHLVSHSAEPKPFRCGCGVAFTQMSTLKKHEKKHEAREKLQCGECGKSFLYKSSLRRHQERCHSTQECTVCKNTYSGKALLNAHMKKHKAELASLEIKVHADTTMTEELNIQTVTVEFLCLICTKQFQTRQGLEVHNCIREETI